MFCIFYIKFNKKYWNFCKKPQDQELRYIARRRGIKVKQAMGLLETRLASVVTMYIRQIGLDHAHL